MKRLTFRKAFDNECTLRTTACVDNHIMHREEIEHSFLNPPDGSFVRPISHAEHYLTGEVIDKLAEYEDAEEQGLLFRLPCKIGDVVYFPIYDYHDSAIIEQIQINQLGIFFDWVQYEVGVDITECWDDGTFSIDEIGKTVFLTREEAEAALKKQEEE